MNASALSDPNSLLISLSSSLIPDSVKITTLIDCGSTHCFIDPLFVQLHSLSMYSVSPLKLRLIDGTSNSIITQALDLPITFNTGETMTISTYVTPLDSPCSLVLGYNWLTRYNPLIDWVLGSINFRSKDLGLPIPSSTSPVVSPALLATQAKPTPTPSSVSVSLISASEFVCVQQSSGTQCFTLSTYDLAASGKSVSVSPEAPDLSHVPEEFHDFADVFSKGKADMQIGRAHV